MNALDQLEKRAHDLGYAKALLQDFLTALDAPEDVRPTFLNYAKVRAARALSPDGTLSN